MIFFPNCKINIGLDVLRRREDGFHDIQTLMFPVSGLCDILEIVPWTGDGLMFTQSGTTIECPHEENLCVKAYNLIAQRYSIGGVKMHLNKIIPSGAGLGGGSADAAFTIKGLNKIFSLGMDTEEMKKIAARLGSDTPFFILNEPQMACGRGEILAKQRIDLTGKTIVIVKPDIHISTAQAYKGVTPEVPAMPLEERLSTGLTEWKNNVANTFEPSLFANYPTLPLIKKLLYDKGAGYASLSGSGSALYGIFNDSNAAQNAATEIKQTLGDENLFVYQQLIG